MNNAPIGIFDSGIGGLTVAHAIHELLPNEEIIYFGDTAHLPYGDKSSKAIKHYSSSIAEFLLKKKCKMIVIACNTASSHAYQEVKEIAQNIPVVNVIDPIVTHLTDKTNFNKIGVIGTRGTVSTDVYAKKILKEDQSKEVSSLATPLLAPMIEEGFFDNEISQAVLKVYLSSPKLNGVEALVLGCTHYPLIKEQATEFYDNKVHVLDSAQIVADHIKSYLNNQGMMASPSEEAEHHFFVSDLTESFQQISQMFFGENIKLEEENIWD